MDLRGVIQTLSQGCRDRKIDLLLVGGWALGAYGVFRQTLDIDFALDEKDEKAMGEVLAQCGYRRTHQEQLVSRYRSLDSQTLDVDLLLLDAATFKKLQAEKEPMPVGNATFDVPCLRHLIAMKLHAIKNNPRHRWSKDFPDVMALVELNNVNVRTEEFKTLCLTFGTPQIYDQILEAKHE